MSFVHLHVHTSGSIFDGACDISRLVKRAKELNMTALGISDHGNMIKAFEFQQECIKEGIKPIIGCEFYVGTSESEQFHLLCIAKDNKGLENLYLLNAFAYSKNFYKKPRITYEQLQMHKEGIIVTTACIGSEVGQLYLQGDKSGATALIERLKSIVDELYLEIQPNSIPAQADYNRFLISVSQQLGIPLIATCDIHYVLKEDFTAHDVMLAMQTQKKVDDPDRFRFSCNDFYLKTEEAIGIDLMGHGISTINICDATENTQHIADSCTAKITPGNYMPHLDCDERDVLAKHCEAGWQWRYERGDIEGTKEEFDRVQYELKIIQDKGYSGYFLIVEDFIKWSVEHGIYVGAGRGSAAGSMVAYLLGIHKVNPLKYGLLFERMLNPDRDSPPDIDSDFDYERRQEVIAYVQEKYGADKVSRIIAEGTMACNSVVRRVLSTYDFEQKYINRVCNTIPDLLGISLERAYLTSPEFRIFMDKHKKQYEIMQTLEGLMSHSSTHAAGIAICNQPIDKTVPCMTDAEDRGMYVSQWHKKILEKLGIYKFDFLGLKTLTVLRIAVEMIKQNYGVDIDLDKINLSDPIIYQVLNSGDLSGVFQFDAPAGKQTIERIRPTCFSDIIAGEALCRPGVKERDLYLRNKEIGLRCTNSITNNILDETYGAIVYQEQTMLLMNRLTGCKWTLGMADSMRKVKNLEDYREDFVKGCVSNDISADFAQTIFNRFSLEYSFNKSHATSYAVLSAQTAWLKGKYRKEFMAALMTVYIDKTDDMPTYIKECQRYGIKILPPEMNLSSDHFVTTEGNIRMPFSAIKGVGDAAVKIIRRKQEDGLFSDFRDFVTKTRDRAINKKVIIALVKAGCFDSVQPNRNLLISDYLTARGESQQLMTWCPEICIHYELETLGMALTRHPLDGYSIPQFANQQDGECWSGGTITKVSQIVDKNGKDMAFITIENKTDVIECIIFSYAFAKCKPLLLQNNIVKVTGIKEGSKIKVSRMELL